VEREAKKKSERIAARRQKLERQKSSGDGVPVPTPGKYRSSFRIQLVLICCTEDLEVSVMTLEPCWRLLPTKVRGVLPELSLGLTPELILNRWTFGTMGSVCDRASGTGCTVSGRPKVYARELRPVRGSKIPCAVTRVRVSNRKRLDRSEAGIAVLEEKPGGGGVRGGI